MYDKSFLLTKMEIVLSKIYLKMLGRFFFQKAVRSMNAVFSGHGAAVQIVVEQFDGQSYESLYNACEIVVYCSNVETLASCTHGWK